MTRDRFYFRQDLWRAVTSVVRCKRWARRGRRGGRRHIASGRQTAEIDFFSRAMLGATGCARRPAAAGACAVRYSTGQHQRLVMLHLITNVLLFFGVALSCYPEK